MQNLSQSSISTPAGSDPATPPDAFVHRHIGPQPEEQTAMLATLGYQTLEQLTADTVPADIRLPRALNLPEPLSEASALAELRQIATQNIIQKSFLGMGYYGTHLPPVIQRNILENPGWYTQYTPYQAEIAQGRLEALINFQTMVADLTGLPIANASLLDEATAAVEAMGMCHALQGGDDDSPRNTFFVSAGCHPQTIAVVQTRARALGLQCVIGDETTTDFSKGARSGFCGALLQYPATAGRVLDLEPIIQQIHAAGALAVVATDLLALTILREPGAQGADIAIGSAQRFGVPMGFGGPHAAFMATRPEFVRKMPGRLIGISKDAAGKPAYRLALQTREQHIRRDKATSNICTAQVLLAIMAGMYAVYHGPAGLKAIATAVHEKAARLASALQTAGLRLTHTCFFDTLSVQLAGAAEATNILATAKARGINLRDLGTGRIGLSLDETTADTDLQTVTELFGAKLPGSGTITLPPNLHRQSAYLTHPVFHRYHSETEMMRYIKRLESRDLSLAQSMIPLGSCTMKLNAAAEMLPITWPEFGNLHPYAPADQTCGYQKLAQDLETWLAEITGFAAVSLQPNAGSQGEYAGLLTIRNFHISRGQASRNVCLIPTSAHGTNPASAVVAGFKVVPVACDSHGNIDLDDLRKRAAEHAADLGALMVTYPSTHGVFEEAIREICQIAHQHGGQVYMDGANMNAQVGLCRPGDIGADVCHLNLHKTFCIPHGGGGPGMGPIAAAAHLRDFLPGNPLQATASPPSPGPVSAAPLGSASILPISWMYIRMMGAHGLKTATQVAILNANYMAKRLENDYPILFKGRLGRCAHEFIVDCHAFDAEAGVKVEDIAKRLMDYGYHAPTMSWPEHGTLMIEPTESESRAELDRFCAALLAIRQEIRDIAAGRLDRNDHPLKHAPHTLAAVTADTWSHSYTRQQAAYPAPWLHDYKFWPAASRIDNPYGDRHLVCSCAPMEP